MSGDAVTIEPAGLFARWWALVAFLLRLGLAVVFLLAAWTKLQYMGVRGEVVDIGVPGPVNFADAIRAYRIPLPDWLVSWATYTIPFTEVIVAAALILGLWARAAGLVFALLMGVFLVGILNAILRGYDIKCGCFGDLKFFCEGQVDWCKVRENLAFAAGALLIAVLGPGRMSLDWIARRG